MTSTNDVRDIVNIDVVDQKQKDRLPDRLKAEFQDLEKQFVVDKSKLKAISARFQEELEEGLKANGSNIAMYVTWVLGFPSGKEKGSYLTVDLGGDEPQSLLDHT